MGHHKAFIATTTFGQLSSKPLELLKSLNVDYSVNNKGRRLTEEEICDALVNVDAVIAGTEPYTENVLSSLPKLKVISRLGVGFDNIDIVTSKKKDIKIFTTKTSPAQAVAELTLGLILNLLRKITYHNNQMEAGIWKKNMGFLLSGKTLGIIGLGTIGKELVRIASGFGFHILAFDEQEDKLFAKDNDVTYCELENLLKSSDIVTIHLNLSDQTKLLIDKEKVKLMKPEAILINTSRGEIIDENALYEALINNRVGGAGLDVFENEPYTGPLTKLDNVVLTPHIGAYAKEIRIKMEVEAAENLIRGLNEL